MFKSKKLVSLVLVVAMMLSMLSHSMVVKADELITTTAFNEDVEKVNQIVAFYESNEADYNDWELIISLFDAKGALSDEFFGNLSWDSTTIPDDAKGATIGSHVLALIAMNQDPRNIWGKDYIAKLEGMQDENGSFGTLTDNSYAALALEIAEGNYDQEGLVDSILAVQNEDGGFGFSEGFSDIDSTGFTLVALANYMAREDVVEAINLAKGYLKSNQTQTGGFIAWGSENSNSISRVITGLMAIDEDIEGEGWIVEGKSMVDALTAYALEDGSYTWVQDPKESNLFSTKQVLMALADVANNESVFEKLDRYYEYVKFDMTVVGVNDVLVDETIEYIYQDKEQVTVGERLEYVLTEKNMPYTILDTDYGPYLTSINNEDAGTFGGYDGWLYQLNGASGMGMGFDAIHTGDDILFYYGGMAPETVVPNVTIVTENPSFLGDVIIKVETTYDEYDQNFNATKVTKNVDGVTVLINGKSYVTNEEGVCTIKCTSIEDNKIVVYKTNENGMPAVVKTNVVFKPVVAADYLYTDNDKVSSWAKDAVYLMKEKGVMEGYNNQFSPDDYLTRAQLVKVLLSNMNLAVAIDFEMPFEDVAASKWYYDEIGTAKMHGIVGGISDTQFAPDRYVTREELVVMIANAYDLSLTKEVDLSMYSDAGELSSWASDAMKVMVSEGIISGYNDQLDPKEQVTREMCAVVIQRVNDLMQETDQ